MNIKRNIKNENGNTAIEYALLMLLIGMIIFLALPLLGKNVSYVFCVISDGLISSQKCESETLINNSKWYVDYSYIDPSLGGTAKGWVCWSCDSTNGEVGDLNSSFERQAKKVASALQKFEKDHDIGMIYGVMDGNKVLTSYQDTYNALMKASKGDKSIKNTGDNYGSIEIVTKTGEAYWYNSDYNEFWDQGPKS